MTTNQQTNQMSIREWIDALNDHPDDPRWLNDNENNLYEVIAAGIYTPHEINDAVELLNRVYPYYALERFHAARWSPLMSNAMIQAMDLRDNEMLIQIFTHLGESHLISGKSKAAHDSFEIALNRARDGEVQPAMLSAYVGLIRLQALNLEDGYNATLFTEALELSHEVNDEALSASLYQALCLAYLTWKQPQQAFEYGQMAFIRWFYLAKQVELGKSAALIAEVLRFTQHFKQAETWLDVAADYFYRTGFNRQDALISYQRGALFVDQGDHEAGEQWLQQSLREATETHWKHYIALASHSLGIVQGKQNRFSEAELNLKQALLFWENAGDCYEATAIHQAMGWLENKRDRGNEARKWLQKGLELSERIPHEGQRLYMQKLIRDTLDEIA